MNVNSNKRKNSIIIGAIAIVAFLFFGLWWVNYLKVVNGTKSTTCTMEAKICPDGSSVGRQGPNCEFASCPATATTTDNVPVNADITLAVGQRGKVGGLSITLNSFVQDSRCPIDVVCIQAGAVNVNVTLADASHYITKNFPSDEVPYSFGNYRISIVDVAPPRQSQREIQPNQYRITFHVAT